VFEKKLQFENVKIQTSVLLRCMPNCDFIKCLIVFLKVVILLTAFENCYFKDLMERNQTACLKTPNETNRKMNTRIILTIIESFEEIAQIRNGTNFNLKG
jgi:hypothetical protein